jgi:hypothetical protein
MRKSSIFVSQQPRSPRTRNYSVAAPEAAAAAAAAATAAAAAKPPPRFFVLLKGSIIVTYTPTEPLPNLPHSVPIARLLPFTPVRGHRSHSAPSLVVCTLTL